jgi:hypothetical protein
MDTGWAEKSRSRLRLRILVTVITLLAIYLTVSLYRTPTCFDGKQNQNEVGPDCGGVCSIMCSSQTQNLNTVWTHAFRVSEGWYSALAYVENTNFTGVAREVPYRFQFYDKGGTKVAERTGSTYVTRDPIAPIFVGRIDTAGRAVYRTTFEWLVDKPVWIHDERTYQVSFEEQHIVPTQSGQNLLVTVHNQGSITLSNVRVVVILYDEQGTAINASESYIDHLLPQSKQLMTFVWPERFTVTPARIEILPRIPAQE